MDISVAKRTNLLILRGIFPKDFARNCVKPSVVTLDVIAYTEIPRKFTDVITWPKFSNLKCWSCDQLPLSCPKFIPVNPDRVGDQDVCDIYGHFCDWNCAVRYIVTEFPKEQQWDALQAICLFESIFSGRKKEKILPSPAKTCMKQYCGNKGITPKQYRDKIESINSDYELSAYRLEHFRSDY